MQWNVTNDVIVNCYFAYILSETIKSIEKHLKIKNKKLKAYLLFICKSIAMGNLIKN